MKAPSKKPKEPIPADTYDAICYMVCDMGTQKVEYPGKPPSTARQVKLQWEIPELRHTFETDSGEKIDKPKVIGTTYTYSTFEGANLAQHVTSWMGECPRDFDFSTLAGKTCMLNVIHKTSKATGNPYAKVQAVMKPKGGAMDATTENPLIVYDLPAMGRNFPESMMGDNYEWLRNVIGESREFNAQVDTNQEPEYDAETDEQIPF